MSETIDVPLSDDELAKLAAEGRSWDDLPPGDWGELAGLSWDTAASSEEE